MEVGGPLLAEWTRASRKEVLSAGTALIPPYIRGKMRRLFSKSLLDSVRYRVGWGNELALPANVFRLGYAAIVLDDVIVFQSREYARDLELWAHKLGHVRQFKEWGINDFAKKFIRSSNTVEDDADKAAIMFRELGTHYELFGKPA